MHGHKQARWQSRLGNSLRTPRQPDTLPNTTLAHTHVHKHTQNSPFVGGGPPRAGTREGRKVFCQASLLSSQKRHTNTSRRVAAKRHGTLRQWLSVSCGTHRRDTQPSPPPSSALLCVSAENSRRQHHSSSDRPNRSALLPNTASVLQSHRRILDAKLSFLFFLFAVTMQIFPKSELYNSAAAGQRIL